MRSIYDKKGLHTAESQKFAIEISEAVQPVLKQYLEKGFSVRDLSHEAQSVIRDCELDHVMEIHMKNAKKAQANAKGEAR
jgi:hypothetical protein